MKISTIKKIVATTGVFTLVFAMQSSTMSLAADNNYIQPKLGAGSTSNSSGGVSSAVAPAGAGFTLNISDLNFVLTQIRIAEAHSAKSGVNTGTLTTTFNTVSSTPTLVPGSLSATDVSDARLPYGLRQVDGQNNNISNGTNIWNGYRYTGIDTTGANITLGSKPTWGASDQIFPRLTTNTLTAAGNAYANRNISLEDASVRTISNLIADQSSKNPAACTVAGYSLNVAGTNCDDSASGHTATDGSLAIANIAPNAGAAAPYNGMFTLFGQFFDHGLDLISKTAAQTITIPLNSDDPLYGPALSQCRGASPCTSTHMVMPRTDLTTDLQGVNTDTPWIDLSQAYSSDAAHQVYLREYKLVPSAATPTASCVTPVPASLSNPTVPAGSSANIGCVPVATGNLLASYAHSDGLPTWADVKFQAKYVLGINLVDANVGNIPLIVADEYGKFLPGPNGFPVIVYGTSRTATTGFGEGSLSSPVTTSGSVGIGHAFINDMAFNAADPAVLNKHFIAGDGRVNENIGLTAYHTVFHDEHNRLASTNSTAPTSPGTGSITSILLDPRSYPTGAVDWNFVCRWVIGGETAAGIASQACLQNTPLVSPINWNGERLFQAARFVTEMEYQHIVFGEFARKVQPNIKAFVAYDPTLNPSIVAEFANAVYRYGHSQLNSTIDRTLPSGSQVNLDLFDAFTNPEAFYAQTVAFNGSGYNYGTSIPTAADAAGSIAQGMVNQVGNEIDEFVTNTLRNTLLGAPLDLASLNMERARDAGTASLNKVRADLAAQGIQLSPYTSWMDYSLNMRHPESLVNFVAAYGNDTTITSATTLANKRAAAAAIIQCAQSGGVSPVIADCVDFLFDDATWSANHGGIGTGIDDIDLWIGGLAESRWTFGSMLGNTMDYVFKYQMEQLQESDRFYYLGRTAGMNLGVQLETNLISELFMRNTNASALPADLFATPTVTLDMSKTITSVQAAIAASNASAEATKLTVWPVKPATVNGQSWAYSGNKNVVFDGTVLNDQVISGSGNDTVRGNLGDDYLNGGAGNDIVYGGSGDDVITDSSGTDILIGGDGNDYISSAGSGLDSFNGGAGQDFMVGGNDLTVLLGGADSDFEYAGSSSGTLSGDDGSDWLQGGAGADAIVADTLAPFGLDINTPGNDILLGSGGNNTLNGGGGQDIFVEGASGQDAIAGGLEFDWTTYDNGDAANRPAFADLLLAAPPVGNIPAGLTDTFLDVEALSGSALNDVLIGDDRATLTITPATATAAATGDFLIVPGTGQPEVILGLRNLIPNGMTSAIAGSTSTLFDSGNILLGGAGSDVIMGRGGNDLIDGDASINAWLSVPASNYDSQYGTVATPNPSVALPRDPSDATRILVRSMLDINLAVQNKKILIPQIKIVRKVSTNSHVAETDVASYIGAAAQYIVTPNADGTVTVQDPTLVEGTDTLRNIEVIRFGVGTVIPGNNIPVSGLGTGGVPITNTYVLPQLKSLSVSGTSSVAASNLTAAWTNPGSYSGVIANYTVRYYATATSTLAIATCNTANATTYTCTSPTVPLVGSGYATVTPNPVAGITNLVIPAIRVVFSTLSVVIPTPPAPVVTINNNNGTTADANISIPAANVVTGTVYTTTDSVQIGKSCVFTGPATACTITGLNMGAHSFTTVATVGVNSSTPSAATSVTIVAGTPQTINFATVASPVTYGVAPITIAASATSGLPVTITAVATPAGICSLAGSTLTITGAGSCALTANQVGNATFSPAPAVSQIVVINPAPISIVAPTFTLTAGSAALPVLTPTLTGFVNGQTAANLTAQPVCITTPTYTNLLTAGTVLVTSCSGATSANYSFTYTNGQVTLVATQTAPGAPTIGLFVANASGTRSGTLNWTAPGSDGGSPITAYVITLYINGLASPTKIITGNVTSFVLTGLTRLTTYTFTVQARNAIGTGPASAKSVGVRIP